MRLASAIGLVAATAFCGLAAADCRSEHDVVLKTSIANYEETLIIEVAAPIREGGPIKTKTTKTEMRRVVLPDRFANTVIRDGIVIREYITIDRMDWSKKDKGAWQGPTPSESKTTAAEDLARAASSSLMELKNLQCDTAEFAGTPTLLFRYSFDPTGIPLERQHFADAATKRTIKIIDTTKIGPNISTVQTATFRYGDDIKIEPPAAAIKKR